MKNMKETQKTMFNFKEKIVMKNQKKEKIDLRLVIYPMARGVALLRHGLVRQPPAGYYRSACRAAPLLKKCKAFFPPLSPPLFWPEPACL